MERIRRLPLRYPIVEVQIEIASYTVEGHSTNDTCLSRICIVSNHGVSLATAGACLLHCYDVTIDCYARVCQ